MTWRRAAGGRGRRRGRPLADIRPPATACTTAQGRCRPTRSPSTVPDRSRPVSYAPAVSAGSRRQGIIQGQAEPDPNRPPGTQTRPTVRVPSRIQVFRSTAQAPNRHPAISKPSTELVLSRHGITKRHITVSAPKCHRLPQIALALSCLQVTRSLPTALDPNRQPARPVLRAAASAPNRRGATVSLRVRR